MAGGHGHDGYKLISRISRKYIHLSKFFAYYSRYTRQNTVTNSVTVLVIDGLEIINIHANDRQGLTVHALTLSDSLFEHHVEPAGVRQFGKRINESTLLRFFKGQGVVESA